MQGIWNGIGNAKDWIMSKIKGFGESVLNGLKSFFGIKSPSRLFRDEIGKNLALGIGEGFTDEMKSVNADIQTALPTPTIDVDAIGDVQAYDGNQTIIVKVGEETVAQRIIELINDRTKLSGTNAILV